MANKIAFAILLAMQLAGCGGGSTKRAAPADDFLAVLDDIRSGRCAASSFSYYGTEVADLIIKSKEGKVVSSRKEAGGWYIVWKDGNGGSYSVDVLLDNGRCREYSAFRVIE